jgi:hypothetical protein
VLASESQNSGEQIHDLEKSKFKPAISRARVKSTAAAESLRFVVSSWDKDGFIPVPKGTG